MEDFLNRLAEAIVGRIEGPMSFRLVLQPVMAAWLAFRDGRRDARMGIKPYFWTLLFGEPGERKAKLLEGWKSISRVFVLGIVMDLAYQYFAFPDWRPFRAVVVAFILAFIPYLALRGIFNRILTALYRRKNNV